MFVHDLNLELIDPDGKRFEGNVFHSEPPTYPTFGFSLPGGWYRPDDKNVEEGVILRPDAPIPRFADSRPKLGRYVIVVEGANVPYGPQPFALVVTGGIKIVNRYYSDDMETSTGWWAVSPSNTWQRGIFRNIPAHSGSKYWFDHLSTTPTSATHTLTFVPTILTSYGKHFLTCHYWWSVSQQRIPWEAEAYIQISFVDAFTGQQGIDKYPLYPSQYGFHWHIVDLSKYARYCIQISYNFVDVHPNEFILLDDISLQQLI